MKPASGTYIVYIEDEFHDIYRDDTKVGDATLYIYPEHVMVDNIDIHETYQGQGIGRDVVTLLRRLPGISAITGDSVPSALPFWAKMGAILDSSDMDSLDEDDDESLVSFEISWRNSKT